MIRRWQRALRLPDEEQKRLDSDLDHLRDRVIARAEGSQDKQPVLTFPRPITISKE